MTRSVVTGGAGFVGSHLCDALLARGDEVVCVDDLSTGRRENLAHLADHPRFLVRVHDVTEPFDLQADRIFHLACPASPVQYQRNAIGTVRTNVLGTLHTLELAERIGARVLLASTSEVYGDPAVHPQPESYCGNVDPTGPRACYDEGKRVAETLCFDYHRARGVTVRVARIFNTYGPRMDHDDGRVVSNFIVSALRSEPLIVHGDGSQTRSFCYVDDLITGLIALMEQDETPGPVNLGNPGEVPIIELARLVVSLTGSSSPIVTGPRPVHDPSRRCPDISHARELLGFSPSVPLEQGIRRVVGWFGERLAAG